MSAECNFNVLEHRLIKHIDGLAEDSEEVIFWMDDGTKYRMYHENDCCETVRIVEIVGDDPKALCDVAYVARAEQNSETADTTNRESGTWTFYRLDTSKGNIVIRWLGESNGYYSESVTFEQIDSI
jgi:hypothetical protein